MEHGRMTREHTHENRAHGQHQRGRECAREHSAEQRMQSAGTGGAAAKSSRWWEQEGRMKQGRMEEDRTTGREGRAQQRGEDTRARETSGKADRWQPGSSGREQHSKHRNMRGWKDA